MDLHVSFILCGKGEPATVDPTQAYTYTAVSTCGYASAAWGPADTPSRRRAIHVPTDAQFFATTFPPTTCQQARDMQAKNVYGDSLTGVYVLATPNATDVNALPGDEDVPVWFPAAGAAGSVPPRPATGYHLSYWFCSYPSTDTPVAWTLVAVQSPDAEHFVPWDTNLSPDFPSRGDSSGVLKLVELAEVDRRELTGLPLAEQVDVSASFYRTHSHLVADRFLFATGDGEFSCDLLASQTLAPNSDPLVANVDTADGTAVNVLNRADHPSDPLVGCRGTAPENADQLMWAEATGASLNATFKNEHRGLFFFAREEPGYLERCSTLGSASNPATSCADLAARCSLPDGIYYTSATTQVYCSNGLALIWANAGGALSHTVSTSVPNENLISDPSSTDPVLRYVVPPWRPDLSLSPDSFASRMSPFFSTVEHEGWTEWFKIGRLYRGDTLVAQRTVRLQLRGDGLTFAHLLGRMQQSPQALPLAGNVTVSILDPTTGAYLPVVTTAHAWIGSDHAGVYTTSLPQNLPQFLHPTSNELYTPDPTDAIVDEWLKHLTLSSKYEHRDDASTCQFTCPTWTEGNLDGGFGEYFVWALQQHPAPTIRVESLKSSTATQHRFVFSFSEEVCPVYGSRESQVEVIGGELTQLDCNFTSTPQTCLVEVVPWPWHLSAIVRVKGGFVRSKYGRPSQPLPDTAIEIEVPTTSAPTIAECKQYDYNSCAHVTECAGPTSGVYTIKGERVFCELQRAGGSWALVWQSASTNDADLVTAHPERFVSDAELWQAATRRDVVVPPYAASDAVEFEASLASAIHGPMLRQFATSPGYEWIRFFHLWETNTSQWKLSEPVWATASVGFADEDGAYDDTATFMPFLRNLDPDNVGTQPLSTPTSYSAVTRNCNWNAINCGASITEATSSCSSTNSSLGTTLGFCDGASVLRNKFRVLNSPFLCYVFPENVISYPNTPGPDVPPGVGTMALSDCYSPTPMRRAETAVWGVRPVQPPRATLQFVNRTGTPDGLLELRLAFSQGCLISSLDPALAVDLVHAEAVSMRKITTSLEYSVLVRPNQTERTSSGCIHVHAQAKDGICTVVRGPSVGSMTNQASPPLILDFDGLAPTCAFVDASSGFINGTATALLRCSEPVCRVNTSSFGVPHPLVVQVHARALSSVSAFSMNQATAPCSTSPMCFAEYDVSISPPPLTLVQMLPVVVQTVRLSDQAGNANQAELSWNFTLDSTPPVANISVLSQARHMCTGELCTSATLFRACVAFGETVRRVDPAAWPVRVGDVQFTWVTDGSGGPGDDDHCSSVLATYVGTTDTHSLRVHFPAGLVQDLAGNKNLPGSTASRSCIRATPPRIGVRMVSRVNDVLPLHVSFNFSRCVTLLGDVSSVVKAAAVIDGDFSLTQRLNVRLANPVQATMPFTTLDLLISTNQSSSSMRSGPTGSDGKVEIDPTLFSNITVTAERDAFRDLASVETEKTEAVFPYDRNFPVVLIQPEESTFTVLPLKFVIAPDEMVSVASWSLVNVTSEPPSAGCERANSIDGMFSRWVMEVRCRKPAVVTVTFHPNSVVDWVGNPNIDDVHNTGTANYYRQANVTLDGDVATVSFGSAGAREAQATYDGGVFKMGVRAGPPSLDDTVDHRFPNKSFCVWWSASGFERAWPERDTCAIRIDEHGVLSVPGREPLRFAHIKKGTIGHNAMSKELMDMSVNRITKLTQRVHLLRQRLQLIPQLIAVEVIDLGGKSIPPVSMDSPVPVRSDLRPDPFEFTVGSTWTDISRGGCFSANSSALAQLYLLFDVVVSSELSTPSRFTPSKIVHVSGDGSDSNPDDTTQPPFVEIEFRIVVFSTPSCEQHAKDPLRQTKCRVVIAPGSPARTQACFVHTDDRVPRGQFWWQLETYGRVDKATAARSTTKFFLHGLSTVSMYRVNSVPVPLVVIAPEPQLALAMGVAALLDPIPFGALAPGRPRTMTFIVSNVGSTSVVLSRASIEYRGEGASPFALLTNLADFQEHGKLDAFGSWSVDVRFFEDEDVARLDWYTAELLVHYEGGSPARITMNATTRVLDMRWNDTSVFDMASPLVLHSGQSVTLNVRNNHLPRAYVLENHAVQVFHVDAVQDDELGEMCGPEVLSVQLLGERVLPLTLDPDESASFLVTASDALLCCTADLLVENSELPARFATLPVYVCPVGQSPLDH